MPETLTPTQLSPDAAATDLTSVLATPTSTTVQFAWAPNLLLVLTNGATSATMTLDVGSTVLGQSVTAFSPVTIAASASPVLVGGFHSSVGASAVNGDGVPQRTISVVFSNVTTVKVALVATAAVSG